MNSCHSNPCMNGGICIAKINTFVCHCPSGYSGLNCLSGMLEVSNTEFKIVFYLPAFYIKFILHFLTVKKTQIQIQFVFECYKKESIIKFNK